MRILHVVPDLDPASGGTTRSVLNLSRAQSALGATVKIMADSRALEVFDGVSGVEIVGRPLFLRKFSIPGRVFLRTLAREIDNADVVHLHSVWNGVITAAGWLSGRAGKVVVMTPHGMLDSDKMRTRGWLKRLLLWLVEEENLGRVAGFHCLDASEPIRSSMLSSFSDRPCLVQANGIDSEDLTARAARHAESIGLKGSGKRHLVFLGRLHKIKGLDLQLEVLAELQASGMNVHLHWVGPDDGEWRRLEQLSCELGVQKCLTWHGPLHGDERFIYLRDADAVLLTSHNDCNPVVAAETLALGGVLVATDTCHLDHLGRVGAALIRPRQRQAYIEGLRQVLTVPDRSMELRRNAMKYARARLAPEVLAKEMLEFYHGLLRAKRAKLQMGVGF